MAFGIIQEKSSYLIFVENVWGYICLTELLALDKVHLRKNNEYYIFMYCVPFLFFYLFIYFTIKLVGTALG